MTTSDAEAPSRAERDIFVPIAVVEHHHIAQPSLSTFDIAERLALAWRQIEAQARSSDISLGASSVLAIHQTIAGSLDSEPGVFQDEAGWNDFPEGCDLHEDPGHSLNWIFSALYWRHITKFRFATAWAYTSALRLRYRHPILHLELAKLGPLLNSLSGSGPPLYDGQTFYLQDYASALGEQHDVA